MGQGDRIGRARSCWYWGSFHGEKGRWWSGWHVKSLWPKFKSLGFCSVVASHFSILFLNSFLIREPPLLVLVKGFCRNEPLCSLYLSSRVRDKGLPFQLEVAQSLRKSSDPLVQTF